MTIIHVSLPSGYSGETRSRLRAALHSAVTSSVPTATEPTIHVREDVSTPDDDAVGLVRDFLGAMERRALDEARALTAREFRMVFPGGVEFHDLDALVNWARTRYRYVRKCFSGFDTIRLADHQVVYCRGTLTGEWPDGTAFRDVRFVDRFTIRQGRLLEQEVWNDLEAAAADSGGTG